MRLTTKGRYAVTAMLEVALGSGEAPLSAAEIAKRQNISLPYLEQLFARLRQHRLVESVHGPGGGYRLAKAAQEISVADIIQAVNEPIDATRCHGKLNCHDGERCTTHDLWAELNIEIARYLASVTLYRLAARQRERKPAIRPLRHLAQPLRKEHERA